MGKPYLISKVVFLVLVILNFAPSTAKAEDLIEEQAVSYLRKLYPFYHHYSWVSEPKEVVGFSSPIKRVTFLIDHSPKHYFVAYRGELFHELSWKDLSSFIKDLHSYVSLDSEFSHTPPTQEKAEQMLSSVMSLYSPGIHQTHCVPEKKSAFLCEDAQVVGKGKKTVFHFLVNPRYQVSVK